MRTWTSCRKTWNFLSQWGTTSVWLGSWCWNFSNTRNWQGPFLEGYRVWVGIWFLFHGLFRCNFGFHVLYNPQIWDLFIARMAFTLHVVGHALYRQFSHLKEDVFLHHLACRWRIIWTCCHQFPTLAEDSYANSTHNPKHGCSLGGMWLYFTLI